MLKTLRKGIGIERLPAGKPAQTAVRFLTCFSLFGLIPKYFIVALYYMNI